MWKVIQENRVARREGWFFFFFRAAAERLRAAVRGRAPDEGRRAADFLVVRRVFVATARSDLLRGLARHNFNNR
ncbi:MAG: hypothetical protein QOH26_1699 [Actinomycetota bacterium]|jgi:hypothetical protein|nr:hypothetical protein [Actinomycetota bacterium]